VVTWATPTNIVYGTLLGANQNNATSTVAGIYLYSPTNGAVLRVGTNQLSVVFTPADTNYAGTNLTVRLVVTPAPLVITAVSTNKVYGTTLTLGSGQTAFTSSGLVNGETIGGVTLASAGAASAAAVGTYPIVPSLAAGGTFASTNYTINYSNGTLTVGALVSTVTWATPTNIIYGTPLGSSQNNASGTVSGTYVYSPPNGTLLSAGSHQLSVAFTPTDTAHYASTNLTVILVVSPASLLLRADDQLRQYSQTNPVFTYTASGFVNGEGTGVLAGSPLLTTTATSATLPGNYPITAAQGTLVASNYIVSFANGILRIPDAADVAVFLDSPTNGISGTNIIYNITVTNMGPSTASNVVVWDSLPTGMVFVSASSSPNAAGSLIVWPVISSLASGSSTNYTLTVRTIYSGVYTNPVISTADTYDPNPYNNTGMLGGGGTNGSSTISIGGPQFIVMGGNLVLNPATGLYEQSVTVTCVTNTAITGVRLLVGNLPSGVVMFNSAGTNGAASYTQFPVPMNPGDTATFYLQFVNPRRLSFTNSLQGVAAPYIPYVTPGGTGVPIAQLVMDQGVGKNLHPTLGFITTAGKVYQVFYSSDLQNWTMLGTFTGIATSAIWVDPLPSAPTRFYRVVSIP